MTDYNTTARFEPDTSRLYHLAAISTASRDREVSDTMSISPVPLSARGAGQQHDNETTFLTSPNLASSPNRLTSSFDNEASDADSDAAMDVDAPYNPHHTLTTSATAVSATDGKTTDQAASHEAEDGEIKRLRIAERMTWAEIARILNAERIRGGGEPRMTEAGVYARFIRSSAGTGSVEDVGEGKGGVKVCWTHRNTFGWRNV